MKLQLLILVALVALLSGCAKQESKEAAPAPANVEQSAPAQAEESAKEAPTDDAVKVPGAAEEKQDGAKGGETADEDGDSREEPKLEEKAAEDESAKQPARKAKGRAAPSGAGKVNKETGKVLVEPTFNE